MGIFESIASVFGGPNSTHYDTGGYGDLTNTYRQWMNGQGPNVAGQQAQNTAQMFGNQAAGLIANTKGLSPQLAARQATMAQSTAGQQVAGQAALADLMQQIAGAQGLQGITQAGMGANSQAAMQNADFFSKLFGGAANGAGAAMGMGSAPGGGGAGMMAAPVLLAGGGEVPHSAPASEFGRLVMQMQGGGMIPGQAQVAGDSYSNDTVPIAASPGEIMLPRSVTQAPDAPDKARDFVEEVLAGKGPSRKVRMAEGGMVEAMKAWLAAKGEGDKQKTGQAVAEEGSKHLPAELMPRAAIEAKRKQLDDLDRDTKGE
jgi:hypothetical protein